MRRIRQSIQFHVADSPAPAGRLNRRELLKAGGLALGAAFMSGRVGATTGGPFPAPRIGIVGAGIGGLVAALTLQDRGFPCEVFEASYRVGGRMHSNGRYWQGGQTSEWCGEFIDSTHQTLIRLAARFGLSLADVNAADPDGSQATNYFLGDYYTLRELAADVRAIAPILVEQNAAIGPVATYDDYTRAGYEFDHLSAYDWIDNYVPGGHASRLGQYLDVATATENGLDTDQQSSLNLIVPLDSDERYHISGGNEQLPVAIAASLQSGSVRTGWRLTAIAAEGGDRGEVTLRFSTPSGACVKSFDYVILALPFSVLRNLDYRHAGFDPLMQQMIAQLGYGTNSKLVLQFDERYWNGGGNWPGISNGFIQTDLPFQSAWDSSRAEPSLDGLLTDYTGGSRGAAFKPAGPYTTSRGSGVTADYARAFLAELEVVWPGVSSHYNGLATLSYPAGDPNLLGSYSTYKVGQYTQFGNYARTAQERVFFAGEHTSYEFQGFMEGGAESGERAAGQLLARMR
jgi:monoamine oxidase